MADGNAPQPAETDQRGVPWSVRADQANERAAEMEARYDTLTLVVRDKMEQIGELTAEVARLKGELDNKDADHHTIHVKAGHLQMAMVVCKGEDPGTVLRETDGQRRDYVLGEDSTWTAR